MRFLEPEALSLDAPQRPPSRGTVVRAAGVQGSAVDVYAACKPGSGGMGGLQDSKAKRQAADGRLPGLLEPQLGGPLGQAARRGSRLPGSGALGAPRATLLSGAGVHSTLLSAGASPRPGPRASREAGGAPGRGEEGGSSSRRGTAFLGAGSLLPALRMAPPRTLGDIAELGPESGASNLGEGGGDSYKMSPQDFHLPLEVTNTVTKSSSYRSPTSALMETWDDTHDALHIWAYAMQEDDEASRKELAAWLDKIPFFQKMDAFVFERILPIIKKRGYKRGDAFLQEGCVSDSLHVIYAGYADVVAGGSVLTSVGPGSVVGERALANLGGEEPPVAGATLLVTTTVLVTVTLPRAPLLEIVSKDAWLHRQFEELYKAEMREHSGCNFADMALFKAADPQFVLQLEVSMASRKVKLGEVLVREGEETSEAFILTHGTLKITHASQTKPVMLTVNSFMDAVLLCEMNVLGLMFSCTCTVRAITTCKLQVITQDALRKVFDAYPAESRIFRNLVEDPTSFTRSLAQAPRESLHGGRRQAIRMRKASMDDALKKSRASRDAHSALIGGLVSEQEDEDLSGSGSSSEQVAFALTRGRSTALHKSKAHGRDTTVGEAHARRLSGTDQRMVVVGSRRISYGFDEVGETVQFTEDACIVPNVGEFSSELSSTAVDASDVSTGRRQQVLFTDQERGSKPKWTRSRTDVTPSALQAAFPGSGSTDRPWLTRARTGSMFVPAGQPTVMMSPGVPSPSHSQSRSSSSGSFLDGSGGSTDTETASPGTAAREKPGRNQPKSNSDEASRTLCGSKRIMISHDLRLVPEFTPCSMQLLRKLEAHMHLRLYLPEQVVLRYGEDMGDISILQRGVCKMAVFSTEVEPIESPCIIGGMMSLLTPKVVTTVVAEVTSFIANISKHHVAALLDNHPADRKTLFSHANRAFTDLCDDFHKRFLGKEGLAERLSSLPLLSGASHEFLNVLAGALEPRLLLPGQAIVQEPGQARLFILFEGYCHVLLKDRVVGTVSNKMVFGEMEVFGMSQVAGTDASATPIVKTVEFCQVGTVDRLHLEKALKMFPEERPRFEQLVHTRLEESVCSHVSNQGCLEGMPPTLFSRVCGLLERRLCFQNATVVQHGDAGDSMIIVNRGKAELIYQQVCVGMLWPGKSFGSPQMLGVARHYHASLVPKTPCHLLLLTRQALNSLAIGTAERRWTLSLRHRAQATYESELKNFQKKVREQKHMACCGMFQTALAGDAEDTNRFLGSVFYAWATALPSRNTFARKSLRPSIKPQASAVSARMSMLTMKSRVSAAGRARRGVGCLADRLGTPSEPPAIYFMRGLRRVQLEDTGEGIVSPDAWRLSAQHGRLDAWRCVAAPDWLAAVRDEIPNQFMRMKQEARGGPARMQLSGMWLSPR